MNDPRSILARETAHFTTADKALVAWLLVQAESLAADCPAATEDALVLKLLTLDDCPRWVRVLIARAALRPVEPSSPALAA